MAVDDDLEGRDTEGSGGGERDIGAGLFAGAG